MKKKLLECNIHGLTLFRCKRRCWKGDKKYAAEYTEKCFKCINEGRYKKDVRPVIKKKMHIKIE